MGAFIYTGEMNVRRIREAYLKAVLKQDIAFFDKEGAGAITTRCVLCAVAFRADN